MSIHHEVSVHCDVCGQWEHGNDHTASQRRRLGWDIWQQAGHWCHLCPRCTAIGKTREDVPW